MPLAARVLAIRRPDGKWLQDSPSVRPADVASAGLAGIDSPFPESR